MLNNDPYLDKSMRGWITNMAVKNHGRVANFSVDDLVQEFYLCFYKCKNRYVGKRNLRKRDGTPCKYLPPKRPDEASRKHFMSLVQTTIGHRLSDLALKQPAGWELAISGLGRLGEEQSIDSLWDRVVPPDQEDASVAVLLQNAPSEIKQLFQILISDALEFTGYNRVRRRRRLKRETTNQKFCRLLGIPTHDIVGDVERYFLG